jgi:hypothetical protein
MAMKDRNERPEGAPDARDDGARKPGRPRRTESGIKQYEAIRLHFEGKTNVEIAKHVGVSAKTVSRWLAAPYVTREVGKHLAGISAKIWARIGEEAEPTFADLIQSTHCGDPRIELRARTWLVELILEIMPMPRLIADGLLAEDAVPPVLQPPPDTDEEGDAE